MPSITFNMIQELKDDFDDKLSTENRKRRKINKTKQTMTSIFIDAMKQYAYGRKTK